MRAARAHPDAVGQVTGISFLGSIQRVRLRWNEHDLLAETSSAVPLQPGQSVFLAVGADDCGWVRA